MDNVPLRFSRRARLWLLWQVGGSLALTPLVGLQTVARHEHTFLFGLWLGLGVWGVLMLVLIFGQYNTVYRIHGDYLIGKGFGWGHTNLVRAHSVRLEVWHLRFGRGRRYLILQIDDRRIKMGEPRMPCYYAADGLRCLATVLERSAAAEVRDVAPALRTLADNPYIESWPASPAPSVGRA